MSWARLNDTFWQHPKTIKLRCAQPDFWLQAVGCWTTTLSYACANFTDGLITPDVLDFVAGKPGKECAGFLVDCGLWHRAALQCQECGRFVPVSGPEGIGAELPPCCPGARWERVDGYLIHDFLEYNKSRAKRDAELEADRIRKRNERAEQRRLREAHGRSRRFERGGRRHGGDRRHGDRRDAGSGQPGQPTARTDRQTEAAELAALWAQLAGELDAHGVPGVAVADLGEHGAAVVLRAWPTGFNTNQLHRCLELAAAEAQERHRLDPGGEVWDAGEAFRAVWTPGVLSYLVRFADADAVRHATRAKFTKLAPEREAPAPPKPALSPDEAWAQLCTIARNRQSRAPYPPPPSEFLNTPIAEAIESCGGWRDLFDLSKFPHEPWEGAREQFLVAYQPRMARGPPDGG